jgi:hypothetical protein
LVLLPEVYYSLDIAEHLCYGKDLLKSGSFFIGENVLAFDTEEITRAHETVKRLGSQRAAAEELGISRSALQRRLYAASDDFLERKAEELGFDASQVSSFWAKSSEGSFHIKRDTTINYPDLRQEFIDFAHSHSPTVREKSFKGGDHLLVVDPADFHFNKMALAQEVGEDYNIDIAKRRLASGVEGLLSKAEGFGIDRIAFVLGNDFLHTDNSSNTTTSGTRQDAETLWWDAYTKAKEAFISAIEMCTEFAPVHLVHNASNHDWESGWMLSDSIGSWFRNDENVNIGKSSLSIAHRKYMQYGRNLIGFTHGDGAKETDLTSIMQMESRKEWSETAFATWYLHHLHHKDRKSYGKKRPMRIEKDHTGVTIIRPSSAVAGQSVFTEVVRSASGADSWHHRNAYLSKQAIECFLHHVEDGPTARFTHWC